MKPRVVWLTGLSAAGKTTIAKQLVDLIKSSGLSVVWLDGDNVRRFFERADYDGESRKAHNLSVARTAALLLDQGIMVVVSLISPYADVRAQARELVPEGDFLEVFVRAPLDVCEKRDPKGLYGKARSGDLPLFTGVDPDMPYEEPTNPDLVVNTSELDAMACTMKIISALR